MLLVPFALAAAFVLQPQPAASAPADVRDRKVFDVESPVAQELVAAYRAKSASKISPEEKLAALSALTQGKHKLIADELTKALKDGDSRVRLEAVKLLGTQVGDVVRPTLLQFCRVKNFDAALGPEAIRSLGYVGYGPKGVKQLEDLFFAGKNKDARKAIVEAIGRQKDKQGLSLIVVLLDPPRPKDPNDPANPPATFWGEKNDEWMTYRDDVFAAFEAITGRKFYSSGPAIEWIEKEGKKLGLKIEAKKSPWL